jgi:hypothetical protein
VYKRTAKTCICSSRFFSAEEFADLADGRTALSPGGLPGAAGPRRAGPAERAELPATRGERGAGSLGPLEARRGGGGTLAALLVEGLKRLPMLLPKGDVK